VTAAATPAAPAALALRGIAKRYPGVVALAGVDLDLAAGTVHALVGENGAGKSTLLRVMAGATMPDAGTIAVAGRPVRFAAPRDALTLGITVIYQEFALVPQLSAGANVLLGMEPGGALIDRVQERHRATAALESLGARFDPATPCQELSVAERQIVELARALVREARVVALDEPTAALSPRETEHLFGQIEQLRARGIAVVYVSHRLEEVRRLADTITVLRDGAHVWTGPAAQVDDADLIRLMVGRDVEYVRQPAARAPEAETTLVVRDLTRAPAFHGVSFDARAGEVLALAGLVGAGRTEVARCVAGADAWDAGQVVVRGTAMPKGSPRAAIARRIVYLPEDRKTQGLVLGMSVRENVSLASLPRFSPRGVVRRREEDAAVAAVLAGVDLRQTDPSRPAATLSGGNQQKLVMAKWLLADADVLLIDEPTRGVDVGAKVEIHRRIRALADAGKTVVVISSELPEVLALADRIVVMSGGRVTGELDGATATAEQVLELALRDERAA